MLRRHWRELDFWRWLWQERVRWEVKILFGAALAALVLGGGWLAADRLAGASAAGPTQVLTVETTVQKLVTVREKGRVVHKLVPVGTAMTSFKTLTDRTTEAITVHGRVTTVIPVVTRRVVTTRQVVTANGKTKTVVTTKSSVTTLVVPTTNTETRTSTDTVTQVQTRTQTQSQTVTVTRTVTQPVTTTQTTTATVPTTVTVTVTQPLVTVTL